MTGAFKLFKEVTVMLNEVEFVADVAVRLCGEEPGIIFVETFITDPDDGKVHYYNETVECDNNQAAVDVISGIQMEAAVNFLTRILE